MYFYFFFFTYEYICRRFDQPEIFFYYPNDHLTTGWPQLILIRTCYVQIKSTDNSKKPPASRDEMSYLTVIRIHLCRRPPYRIESENL